MLPQLPVDVPLYVPENLPLHIGGKTQGNLFIIVLVHLRLLFAVRGEELFLDGIVPFNRIQDADGRLRHDKPIGQGADDRAEVFFAHRYWKLAGTGRCQQYNTANYQVHHSEISQNCYALSVLDSRYTRRLLCVYSVWC